MCIRISNNNNNDDNNNNNDNNNNELHTHFEKETRTHNYICSYVYLEMETPQTGGREKKQ